MNMRLREMLLLYQWVAGLCDAGTGLLLLVFPVLTFHVMGLRTVPQPVAFARYIGVFVMAVGITYLWTVTRWRLNEHAVLVWLTQWKITAFVRACVAVFILWQLSTRALELRWISVALTDGIFAAVQVTGLRQEWIERAV